MGVIGRRRFLRLGALAAACGLTGLTRAARARAPAKGRVVIIGGGFAGAACALQLRRLDASVIVSLIDPIEYYATCPMSNEVLVGLRDMASITLSRAGLQRAGVTLVRDRVAAIDATGRSVRLERGRTLPFDRLVVAPGIRFLWNKPDGYDEAATHGMPHAWQAGGQTQRLAMQLRAMDDGGVVAISVPAGLMRCPPAPYERASLIAHYLSRHKPRSKVLIFDSNNHFPRQDLFSAAWQSLYPGMIEWIAPTQDGAVVRVDTASMTVYTANAAHRVAVANIIPPQAPGQIAADAGLASDHGWCPIAPETFESQLIRNLHVIGDACIADAMPKSASAAVSQARQCARAIVSLLAGREVPAPAFDSVCYSMLAPDSAISIHGRFAVQEGRIAALELPAELTGAPCGAQQARAAQRWYGRIRAESFAG
ncbi:MAG TPA: FAD-dependent oxidoreductase [Steroidobacteraceae bacterium]|jgi:NADPH-dependent 2,4-dienoyl-CoA reductase/sulfur reductase-like enzyme|nr:FAD-dependent oxidoreductase [Steroidobacteraceae bacterium]